MFAEAGRTLDSCAEPVQTTPEPPDRGARGTGKQGPYRGVKRALKGSERMYRLA